MERLTIWWERIKWFAQGLASFLKFVGGITKRERELRSLFVVSHHLCFGTILHNPKKIKPDSQQTWPLKGIRD